MKMTRIFLFFIFYFLFIEVVFAVSITKNQLQEYVGQYAGATLSDTIDQNTINDINAALINAGYSNAQITQGQVDAYNNGQDITLTSGQISAGSSYLTSEGISIPESQISQTSNFNLGYPWEKENINELGGSKGLVAKIYLYALAVAGVLAFGILVYGGVLWSISGAVSTQAEAKEWITAAISGLVLLLCAYAILYIINPEITKLNIEKIEKIKKIETTKTTANNCSKNSDCDQSAGYYCAVSGNIGACTKESSVSGKIDCYGRSSYSNTKVSCDESTQNCATDNTGSPYCSPK